MLPPALISLVESHGCFTGCYDSRSDVKAVVNPNGPVERMLHIQCEDCLSFEITVLASHLPSGMYASKLAKKLTEHMRTVRGYSWSIGGYHGGPAKLWLSAVYYACGIALISGERNATLKSDLDCLIAGFQQGVITASDPAMLQPASYQTQTVYLDMSKPIVPVRSSRDILASPQFSSVRKHGYHKLTMAEFLPAVQRAATQPVSAPAGAAAVTQPPSRSAGSAVISSASSPPSPRPPASKRSSAGKKPALGERCPACGELVTVRPSLTENFVGCLC